MWFLFCFVDSGGQSLFKFSSHDHVYVCINRCKSAYHTIVATEIAIYLYTSINIFFWFYVFFNCENLVQLCVLDFDSKSIRFMIFSVMRVKRCYLCKVQWRLHIFFSLQRSFQYCNVKRVWRYQRGNQNLFIKEEQTTQWQKKKFKRTKKIYKTYI